MKHLAWTLLTFVLVLPVGARAQDGGDPAESGVEYMVPEMQGRGFALSDGPRAYHNRLGFGPGFGQLGNEPYYTLRLSFHPQRWLGWEAQLGHNPAESVHALVHSLGAQLRWPLEGRLQPYATASYGMMMIFPGRVFAADPVTKNQLGAGVGLEFFLRDDVAIRGEWRGTTVIGRESNGDTAAYDYREFTLGLNFYRSLEP